MLDDRVKLSKPTLVERVQKHPLGAFIGGVVCAAVAGWFGTIYGTETAIAVGLFGALVGAGGGVMLAESAS